MRRMLTLGWATMALTMGVSLCSAGVIYTAHGFEEPTFTTGTLPGQDHWSYWSGGTKTNIIVQDEKVHAGAQAGEIKNTGQQDIAEYLPDEPSTENQWVDVWVLPPSNDQVSQYPKIYLRNSANKIRATINLTTNDGRINHEPGTSFLTDDWNRITIYVDQDDNKWDVYINGVLALGDQALAYPNTDISHYQIAWTGKGDAGKEDDAYYFDDFQITTTNPIPEPATMGMALGFGGAMLMRRKRK